jgi:hypothetical protein
MDHKQAVATMAVEKYLLDEFDSGEKEAFEEHYFSCHDCAEELKATVALLERGRELFAHDPMSIVERAPESTLAEKLPENAPAKPDRAGRPGHNDWFGWLRPAIAAPAMALLLLVVAVQNLYQVPALEHAMNAPEVLPSAYLPVGSMKGDEHVVLARRGEQFLLTIDLSDDSNAARAVDLYDVAGRKKWSLAVPENAPKGSLTLRMPGSLPAGSYSLVVGGAEAGGGSRYPFALQRQ